MKITVLGAGSWGTTLALVLEENGHEVVCWSFDPEDVSQINKTGENKRFLPGVPLPKSIRFIANLKDSVRETGAIVVVVPSHAVRNVISEIKDMVLDTTIWINAAKGIENKSFLRMSEVIKEVTHSDASKVAVLSGPSHAEEVSRKVPTAIVSGSEDPETAGIKQCAGWRKLPRGRHYPDRWAPDHLARVQRDGRSAP